MSWKKNLNIPSDSKLSPEAIDIVRKLMTDVDRRIGYTGAEEIKKHPFFKNIDWNNIRNTKAPFIPEVF